MFREKTKIKYYAWGDVKNAKFDSWWKTHSYLFDDVSVRKIESINDRQISNSLLIEIPLNESTTVLLRKVKKVIDDELKKKPKKTLIEMPNKEVKSRKDLLTNFQMTIGAEPKLSIIREVLNVYRDVYLKNSHLKGRKMLDKVYKYYESKPKSNQIPYSLIISNSKVGDEKRVLRNLNRWIQWGEKITINVLKGEFPGKYGSKESR